MTARRPVFTRRSLLAGIGATTLLSTRPALAAPSEAQGKLVLVILRGALDGLGAVPRPGDARLRALRKNLIPDNALPLDDGFALHPALAGLHTLYGSGEAAIVHAVSAPHRDRSHFLAQDLLESGSVETVRRDGWLNRTLQAASAPLSAVAIGPTLPLVLRGDAAAATWSPPALPEVDSDTVSRLQDLYAGDELLGPALAAALALDDTAGGMAGEDMGGTLAGPANDAALLEAAGRLLKGENGADIAVVSVGGWDTHAGQAGALGYRLARLDAALMQMKDAIGSDWSRTTVAVVTEFGRTVRENGSRGTDHGTGAAAFVLGGGLKRSGMQGDWPGLEDGRLYEDRDLFPANDLRGLFRPLLAGHFGVSNTALSREIFPDSAGVREIPLI